MVLHRVKGQTAIFEEMIEDEEGLVDDRLPTTSRGLWAASETERALKAMLAFARARRLDAQLLEDASTFMELFESWKKEYKVWAQTIFSFSFFFHLVWHFWRLQYKGR